MRTEKRIGICEASKARKNADIFTLLFFPLPTMTSFILYEFTDRIWDIQPCFCINEVSLNHVVFFFLLNFLVCNQNT